MVAFFYLTFWTTLAPLILFLQILLESIFKIFLLSPLRLELMKLLQKKKEPSVAKKPAEPKKRRIITIIEAIEETPSSVSTPKTAAAEVAPAEASTSEAAAAEATNLENTLTDIDEMILNMAEEETAAATEETPAAVPKKEKELAEDASKERNFNFQNIIGPKKEKELAEDASKERNFNFQNIIGQELSKAEKVELRDYAISCRYKLGVLLFGGIDEESLGCL
jgi:hypothetical protein